MKTRVLTCLTLSLLLALLLSSCGTPGGLTEGPPPAPPVTTPEATVNSFYTWYLDAARHQGSPLLGDKAYQSSVYFTPEFVKQVDQMLVAAETGLVADPFVLAQDIPESFTAESPTVTGNMATVIVHTWFAGNATPHNLLIELKQTGDQWKIAGIMEPNMGAATGPEAMTPEAVVTEFYTWYLGYDTQTNGGNPLVDEAYQSSTLLADELKARVNHLVATGPVIADPFLLAQDVPQSFTVDRAAITGATATVTVHARFAGNSTSYDFVVELKRAGEDWKISDVKSAKPA